MASWQPGWWNDTHMSRWERVKEAIKRDWEQTKHDLGLKSGHYMHQDASDTVKQATGAERIPAPDEPNPPKVLGTWEEVEQALCYGYSARANLGAAVGPWNDELDAALRLVWEGGPVRPDRPWEEVRHYVREGYESPRGAT